MPRPLLIFSQITWSSLLIQFHIINDKKCRSRPAGFYTLFKGRADPDSAGPGLILVQLQITTVCSSKLQLKQSIRPNSSLKIEQNPADTWRLYNVVSMSMQRHDVALTLRRRCINVMCLDVETTLYKRPVPVGKKSQVGPRWACL